MLSLTESVPALMTVPEGLAFSLEDGFTDAAVDPFATFNSSLRGL
jgi:hypothetical protein